MKAAKTFSQWKRERGDGCKQDERPSAAKRGYGRRWQRLRLRVLREEPLCRKCLEAAKVTASVVVDHIVPHKGDMKMMYDRENLQGLCTTCHNCKTAKADGGFNNPKGLGGGKSLETGKM